MIQDCEITSLQEPFIGNYKVSSCVFDVLDYIPHLSVVSGFLRCILGTGQAAIGLVIFPIQFTARTLTETHSSYLLAKGISNIVRGKIATITLGGNLFLYVYDQGRRTKHKFQAFFDILD